MKRRVCILAIVAFSSMGLASLPALAEDGYPGRPIKLLVGFPPGGATDILARVVAQEMSTRLGQPMVVENRPGASASIAASAVSRAPADGYTLLFGSSTTFTVNPALRNDLGYDPVKSFTHLGLMAHMALVFVTSNTAKISSIPDLIAQSKAESGKFFYGSVGTGSLLHFAAERLKYDTGAKVEHVPFSGSGPSLSALMGGQIQIASDTVVATMPLIASGKIKALAVMSEARLPQLPDVPAVAESVPGFAFSTFFTLDAPANLPEAIKRKLEGALKEMANNPDFKKRLIGLGLTPAYGSGVVVEVRVVKELTANRAMAARANIHVD